MVILFVAKIEARAYSRTTEVLERVRTAVLNVYPEELRAHVRTQETKTESHHNIPIIVLVSSLEEKTGCEKGLDYLLSGFSKQDVRLIRSSLHLRTDSHCNLFLRIDKQAMLKGQMRLSDGPDPISIQIHLREFPRCVLENAIALIETRLKSMEE
jgi:RNA binding exosome subunit